MNRLSILAFLVCGTMLVMQGCKDGVGDSAHQNRPPKTYFWLLPDSTIREGNSRQRLRWWGEDPDGVVKGYLFASGKFATGTAISLIPDTLVWKWTTMNDTLLAFPLLVKRDTFGVAIGAVDNSFEPGLPEGAHIRLGSTPYWDVDSNGIFDGTDLQLPTLTAALDRGGATLKIPLLNQPPSVVFAPDPNDPTVQMQQPETTFTAATFSWVGSDPDGDQTIAHYEIALNDTSATGAWFTLSGSVKLVTIAVPRSRSDGATGTVDADVYTGTYLLKRKLDGVIHGLQLDAMNVFYVRARDVAGDVSPVIRLPESPRTWYVRNPRGKLLIVADLIDGSYGNRVSVAGFYKSIFPQIAGGRFAEFELLDIGRGLTATQKQENRVGPMVPPFIDPALFFTLHLFDVVYWYTDIYPSLGVAQSVLFQYTRDAQHPGRVIYSTMFATAADPRGALRDFAPIDSICSVDLLGAQQFPRLGDSRIPGGFSVIPDSSEPGSIFPPLQFNTSAANHIFNMRPVYRRADARYIYYMQDDIPRPTPSGPSLIRYVYGVTIKDLKSVATVGSGIWTCSLNGGIFHSSDDGITWERQESGTSDSLNAVSFIDASTGWVAGNGGTILKTNDGGASWSSVSVITLENLLDVDFTSGQHGVAVGTNIRGRVTDRSIIIRTTNGGESWNSANSGTYMNLNGVDFTDDNTGVVVGDSGVILRTGDGGLHWSTLPQLTTRKLNAVCFATPSVAYAVGNVGSNIKSVDGGLTWTVQTAFTGADLRNVFFMDANNGWIVGTNGAMYATVDGGTSWSARPSGVTQSINGISFGGGGTGLAVGTNGLLIRTENGGANWASTPKGRLNVGVIDGSNRFVFMGLPLHLLNGDGTTLKPFLEQVLLREFGE
jgi:photosystem II stability/assembly factor-like uncharacterized protein